jgi:hypothetical protein
MIDDISINARELAVEVGIATTSAVFTGVGSFEEAQNYRSNITVYDHKTQLPFAQIKGLRHHKLDAHDDSADTQSFMRLSWTPDIAYLKGEALQRYFRSDDRQPKSALHVIIHRDPAIDVLEVNLLNDTESMWISNKASSEGNDACEQYTLVNSDADYCLLSRASSARWPVLPLSMPTLWTVLLICRLCLEIMHFLKNLGLAEPTEPAKPLTVYRLDSHAAIKFRNWLRKELQVCTTTLEIVSAKTLNAIGEKVCEKLGESGK